MGKYRTIVADPPWDHSDGTGVNLTTGVITSVPYPVMMVNEIKALPISSLAEPEAHLYLWTTSAYLYQAYDVARTWGFEPVHPLVWCKAPHGFGLGGRFMSNIEFVLFCRESGATVQVTSFLADAAQTRGITRDAINKAFGVSDMAGWWLSRLPHRARIPTWEQWVRLRELLDVDDRFDEVVRIVNEHRNDTQRCNTRWFTWPRSKHSQKPEHFYDLVEQMSAPPYVELFARRHRLGWDVWGDESANTADWDSAVAN